MEFIREGGVDQIDEEFVMEEGDCLIVCVRRRNIIWLMRQGIWGAEILAQDVLKGKIKFG